MPLSCLNHRRLRQLIGAAAVRSGHQGLSPDCTAFDVRVHHAGSVRGMRSAFQLGAVASTPMTSVWAALPISPSRPAVRSQA